MMARTALIMVFLESRIVLSTSPTTFEGNCSRLQRQEYKNRSSLVFPEN